MVDAYDEVFIRYNHVSKTNDFHVLDLVAMFILSVIPHTVPCEKIKIIINTTKDKCHCRRLSTVEVI